MVRSTRSSSSRLRALTVLVATLLVVSFVLLMEPLQGHMPRCLFHSLTGHGCPSCGMTRSLHALLHGDLPAAYGFHPLGPGVGLALVALNIVLLCDALWGRRPRPAIPPISP